MTFWALFNDNIESALSTGYLFLKTNPIVSFAHAISSLKQCAIYGWVEHNEECFLPEELQEENLQYGPQLV